ncbi:MAG: hypothetical protein E7327_07685 [Clostridiales bacterium]|nr:hypothetical protein [Clostridiales bacterium]
MDKQNNWMDDLLSQVASGHMLPQDALQQFFLHKKAGGDATLTEEDNAFISAMDAVEVAHLVAKWCVRSVAALGNVTAIEADLRRPSFFHPNRRPPLVTGVAPNGRRVMLFAASDASSADEYAEDCLRAAGSFTGASADPAFLPVFMSALTTALSGHGLPAPTFIQR